MYINTLTRDPPHNFTYILVIKDQFSGFVELIPCDSPNSDNAASALSWWIARFSKPEYIISDNGTHFTSKVVEHLSRLYNVSHHFTVPYCPWSNGSVERANRDIKALLKVILKEAKLPEYNWPFILPAVMNVINQTPSERLGGLAPKQVYLGIDAYNPFHVLFAPSLKVGYIRLDSAKIKSHTKQLQQTLDALHQKVTYSRTCRQQLQ